MSARAALLAGAAACAASVTLAAQGTLAASAPTTNGVKCPIAITAAVRWAFSSSVAGYTHGRGTFSGSRVTGTICVQTTSGPHPGTSLVVAVGGRGASLARGITVGGVLGARLVAPVSVTASAGPACRVGTRGTVTLFSSYNGANRDSERLAFGRGCSARDAASRGPKVHVALPQ